MISETRKIYLDFSATTPVDPRVSEAMMPYFSRTFGNASSIHSFGREAKIPLEESRERIARAIGARPGEIFFTSGGTEADNHALLGAAFAGRRAKGRNHVVVSAVEHHAVLRSADYLRENGFEVTVLPVDRFGTVDPTTVRSSLTAKTSVVSVMHANNEIGTIQDIKSIASLVHERGIVFHSDAVQSAGKIAVDVKELSIDLVALSAHKFYGPKGIGVIFIRKGVDVDSMIHGGAQERNRRAGTENVPLAVGCAEALDLSQREMAHQSTHCTQLKRKLQDLLERKFEDIVFNGNPSNSLPNILNVSFVSSNKVIDGEALLLNMDLHGVAVTSGSACSSGSMEPSHVLRAIGHDEKTARSSIRFSLGKSTTEDEIVAAAEILEEVVRKCTVLHA